MWRYIMSTMATWAAAISSVGSLLTALIVFCYNKNKDKRSNAEKVAGWVNFTSVSEKKGPIANITVRNMADLPVYDVFIMGCLNNQTLDNFAVWNKCYLYNNILPPGEKTAELPTLGSAVGSHIVINMFFRDASGREWLRDGKGILKEAKNYKDRLRNKKIFEPYF